MKLLLVLMMFIFSAHGADNLPVMKFEASLDPSHRNLLKNDLKYLLTHSFSKNDNSLLKLAPAKTGKGSELYSWILERVKFLVGESFHMASLAPSGTRFFMVNLGALYYKQVPSIVLNNKRISLTSPRIGIVQVGDVIFDTKFAINKVPHSEANSIYRLGFLFHEARHSDGHGKHRSFFHKQCPPGHMYAGLFGCDSYKNGSYAVEAAALKHLLKNCSTCSLMDKAVLEARVADAQRRILADSDKAQMYMTTIETLTKVNKTNEGLLLKEKSPQRALQIRREIEANKKSILVFEKLLIQNKTELEKEHYPDPRPESIP